MAGSRSASVPTERLVDHTRSVPSGLPLVRRTSDRSDAASRRARRQRRALRPPLQPGRPVRAGTGVAVHGHVPTQPSCGCQRHAARPPIRQRRPRRPPGRLHAGAVRLHRPVDRPTRRRRAGRPAPVAVHRNPPRFRCRARPSRRARTVGGMAGGARLRRRGGAGRLLATEHERPEEHSVGAFLTDRAVDWVGHQTEPWFAHLSYLRPHPPYSAAGEWSQAYDPDDVGQPIAPVDAESPYHQVVMMIPYAAAPDDPVELAHMRAQYFGMVSHVDHQLGRLWGALRRLGVWDDTVVIVTADHGEMLGDHGLRRRSATGSRATPSRASSATRPTRRPTAPSSSTSPRTST